MPLYPHQSKAQDAIAADFEAGTRRLLVSMATGTGKTHVFASLIDAMKGPLPGKMLVLAHTEELVDQNIATIQALNPALRVDKEMAAHHADPSQADVIVASVKSLGRKGTKRVDKYNWSEWDKIVVDEAHHVPASSYRNVLDAAGAMQSDSPKLLLGVTATTQRADGKALGEFFEKISYTYGIRQAITEGWLVDIKGYRVNTQTDLSGVSTAGGDFNQTELSDKINNPERNNRIVEAWMAKGEFRQTVAFCASVEHAKALAAAFKVFGVDAEAIWGDDPEREQKLKDHKTGKIKVLCNFGVLIEGYDDPTISCIILARPIPAQNALLFTQMCGRGTRLQEGTGNLKDELYGYVPALANFIKQDCIVIDVMDNTERHTLMSVPSLLGLHPDLDLKGTSVVRAAETLEKLQEEHPGIDFSKLKDITDVEKFIQAINMFEVRFAPEVEANSDLTWYKMLDGGFRMSIPGAYGEGLDAKRGPSGRVMIYENMLGQWEIDGRVMGEQFHGVRPSMEEAFSAADSAVHARVGGLIHMLNRKASWHDKPVEQDGKQMKLLSKLYPGKQWPENFTKGQASFWIDKRLAHKK